MASEARLFRIGSTRWLCAVHGFRGVGAFHFLRLRIVHSRSINDYHPIPHVLLLQLPEEIIFIISRFQNLAGIPVDLEEDREIWVPVSNEVNICVILVQWQILILPGEQVRMPLENKMFPDRFF